MRRNDGGSEDIVAQLSGLWMRRGLGMLHSFCELLLHACGDLLFLFSGERDLLGEALNRIAQCPGFALVFGLIVAGIAPRMAGAAVG